MANWNILASLFFKNFIYFRLAPPGSKPTVWAQVGTNLFSAFWHGFYPGYYFYFGSMAVVMALGKRVRAKLRPWVVASHSKALHRLYDVITLIFTHLAFTHGGPYWTQLSYEASVTYLVNTRFFYPLCAIAIYAATYLIPRAPGTDHHKKDHHHHGTEDNAKEKAH